MTSVSFDCNLLQRLFANFFHFLVSFEKLPEGCDLRSLSDGTKSILRLLRHDELHRDDFRRVRLNDVAERFVHRSRGDPDNRLNVSDSPRRPDWPENDDGHFGVRDFSGIKRSRPVHSREIAGIRCGISQLDPSRSVFVRHFHR